MISIIKTLISVVETITSTTETSLSEADTIVCAPEMSFSATETRFSVAEKTVGTVPPVPGKSEETSKGSGCPCSPIREKLCEFECVASGLHDCANERCLRIQSGFFLSVAAIGGNPKYRAPATPNERF